MRYEVTGGTRTAQSSGDLGPIILLGRLHTAMSMTRRKAIGWVLVGVGICIAASSQKIVFPGLESVLGIETLVGKKNVVYLPEGGCAYTNPRAMVRWIFSIAGVGVLVAGIGGTLVFRSRRERTS